MSWDKRPLIGDYILSQPLVRDCLPIPQAALTIVLQKQCWYELQNIQIHSNLGMDQTTNFSYLL